jgi:AcrR family transcriptional regulator
VGTMSPAMPPVPPSATVASLTPAQRRVTAAAHELFAERGISGTSLQMIADALGVTKAAVYHQFPTKDDIVIAVTATELVTMEEALEVADEEDDPEVALEQLIQALVANAVTRRRRLTLLQHDPVVARVLTEHEPFRLLMDRLYRFLMRSEKGDDVRGRTDGDTDRRVQAAMVATAIGACSVHPLVIDLPDDVVEQQMLHYARWLVRIDYVPPAG